MFTIFCGCYRWILIAFVTSVLAQTAWMTRISFPLNSMISMIAVSIRSVLADGDIVAIKAVENNSIFK
jgi:hypothetical protein